MKNGAFRRIFWMRPAGPNRTSQEPPAFSSNPGQAEVPFAGTAWDHRSGDLRAGGGTLRMGGRRAGHRPPRHVPRRLNPGRATLYTSAPGSGAWTPGMLAFWDVRRRALANYSTTTTG